MNDDLAFKKKIEFWTICMRSNKYDCFPTMKGFSEEEGVEIGGTIIEEINQRLKGFGEAFNQYFPNEQQVKYQNELWNKNPFIVNARPSTMSAEKYETFIEMTSDSSLQEKFKLMPLVEFWCSLKDESSIVVKYIIICARRGSQLMCRQKINTATDLMLNLT